MGQYYKAVVIPNNTKITEILSARSYESGLKLTEHSWMGNIFINAVLSRIEERPAEVGWIGDYSDAVDKNRHICPQELFDQVWDENSKEYIVNVFDKNLFINNGSIYGEGYIINHSKKMYIDLKKYVKNRQAVQKDKEYVLFPLSLLTAIGNGLGGGDYYGPGKEFVGGWFMDIIEFNRTDCPPKYDDVTDNCFFEDR